MTGSHDKDARERALGRQAALVIAGAVVLWLLFNWLAPKLGLPGRYALLFDFAAIGALIWALIVSIKLWRARRDQ